VASPFLKSFQTFEGLITGEDTVSIAVIKPRKKSDALISRHEAALPSGYTKSGHSGVHPDSAMRGTDAPF
jgi:hypothetical protein